MHIAYVQRQFQIAQQYAGYWQAMAMTGAAKARDLSHGDGVAFTDQEKVEVALRTMKVHINRMSELSDTIDDLQRQLNRE
jgi:hypothetical protein